MLLRRGLAECVLISLCLIFPSKLATPVQHSFPLFMTPSRPVYLSSLRVNIEGLKHFLECLLSGGVYTHCSLRRGRETARSRLKTSVRARLILAPQPDQVPQGRLNASEGETL